MPARVRPLLVVTGLTGAVLLAGCGSSADPATSEATSSSDAGLSIVTSTDVYGSIAEQVAGDAADVTALIDDPALDPHSFEASARDQLALSRADVVVENGGGYDSFIDTMLESGESGATVVDAVELSGKEPADSTATEDHEHADEHTHEHEGHAHTAGFNEHVFYDLPTVRAVAGAIADALAAKDPAQADTFRANAASFDAKISALQEQVTAAKAQTEGKDVVVTEPVPGYLLEALGAHDVTPAAFSEAIEEETDVPATVLAETLALVQDGTAKAVVYNEQTTGAQTDQVQEAAKAAGVPVVPVTETLPEGKTYEQWMQDNITAIVDALG